MPTEPLRTKGPFGDHTGYYTLPEPYPVFHVTAITHRKDAVYPAIIVGIPPMEDFYLVGAAPPGLPATLSHRMGEGLGVRVQDELPRDRGPCAAGRRRLSQPRLRQHPEDLPVAVVICFTTTQGRTKVSVRFTGFCHILGAP